jgi:hypothetical protein
MLTDKQTISDWHAKFAQEIAFRIKQTISIFDGMGVNVQNQVTENF